MIERDDVGQWDMMGRGEEAAVFHWNSAHSYIPSGGRVGMAEAAAATERFCRERSAGGRFAGCSTGPLYVHVYFPFHRENGKRAICFEGIRVKRAERGSGGIGGTVGGRSPERGRTGRRTLLS